MSPEGYHSHAYKLLKGKEKTDAEKKQAAREAKWAALKVADMKGIGWNNLRICPGCLKVYGMRKGEDGSKPYGCPHMHEEDGKLYEIATLPVESMIVPRGTLKIARAKL